MFLVNVQELSYHKAPDTPQFCCTILTSIHGILFHGFLFLTCFFPSVQCAHWLGGAETDTEEELEGRDLHALTQ